MGEGGWCQRCLFLLKICSRMEEGKNDMKQGILKPRQKYLYLMCTEMEKLFFGCLQDDSWYHRSCCQISLPAGPVQGSQWDYSFVHLLYYCFFNNCFKCSPLSICIAAFLKNMRTNEANAQAWIYTRERWRKGLKFPGEVYTNSLRNFLLFWFYFCLPCSHWEQPDRNMDIYFH